MFVGEIKALKEKLRAADEEIQQIRLSTGNSSTNNVVANSALVGMLNESKSNGAVNETVSSEPNPTECQKCTNYQSQLDSIQAERDRLLKDIDRFSEELSKESTLRRDLERKWTEKREKYNEQVLQLTKKVELNEKQLAELNRHNTVFKDKIREEFLKLTNDREIVCRQLNTLQDENDFLAGRYMASAEEMENQFIDLPNTVEELQEMLLKSNQSLIEARLGCEIAQRKCASSTDEAQILRDQLKTAYAERQSSDRDFIARIKGLEYVILYLKSCSFLQFWFNFFCTTTQNSPQSSGE